MTGQKVEIKTPANPPQLAACTSIETPGAIDPCPFLKNGTAGLKIAQFVFREAPLSTNAIWEPSRNFRKGTSWLHLTTRAQAFRKAMKTIARQQAAATGYRKEHRQYSMWVILRAGHPAAEALDTSNVQKFIEDAFVEADLLPDDSHSRDSRQLYGDFDAAGYDPDAVFAVLIRWGRALPPKQLITSAKKTKASKK